ncbi:hypothetical protein EXIGLDRAFT_634522 [Exidia glandulosa HHB12029]|uniref:Uncharacterized protein n=1 Tax=Exidia glandulosa HHB12029 TaxID=1314781 RepID=A0A165YZU3_EXIGL|nr:hypothetical protein EXIGLDRAFT_634522 [Exidia glandulosa HHB12029]
MRRFEELRGDAYVRARVNARALRVSIRMAIRAHKFEREKLERSYRSQLLRTSCPCKEHQQTKDLVHKREKNLASAVKKFNMLVTQIEVLVRDSKGPKRKNKIAIPRRLDTRKLFQLDVDDDIWQEDPGLGPQDEDALPRWQVDEDVRRGIRALLEVERCREERERLTAELDGLGVWWREEVGRLTRFLEGTTGACG